MIGTSTYRAAMERFLRPIADLLEDPGNSEILFNTGSRIFVERSGRLELVADRSLDDHELLGFLRVVAQYADRQFGEDSPILEAHLPDGSRIEALLPPLVEGGPHVAIRRHRNESWTLERLVGLGSLEESDREKLAKLVRGKRNLLVAGGTGTGKTSVLCSLASAIEPAERIVVIEDARELRLEHPHVVSMQSHPGRTEDGVAPIAIRDLFRATLRMRPDRVVIGEIRGGEALDLLLAMTSGHGGCLSTIHASGPVQALERLETLAMMGGLALTIETVRRLVASAIGGVVQVERSTSGRRFVSHIAIVEGVDASGYRLSEVRGERETHS